MESSMICDHSSKCKQNPKSYSRVDFCSGKYPHHYNHEECDGMHCDHVNGEWVKCLPTHIRNPQLDLGAEGD